LEDYLYNKYADIFDFVDRIVAEAPSYFKGKTVESLNQKISLFHYARALNLLQSIKVLCSEGYATEAMIILRSLLNLFINIKWLTSEEIDYCSVNYRMKRFADYDVVFRKKHKDNIIKFCPGVISENEHAYFDEEFEEIVKKYPKEANFDPKFWSGKNIFEMASEVSLENEYRILYSQLSEMEHTGPSSKNQYIDFSHEGKMRINTGPKDKDITKVLVTAFSYFLDVNAITHSVFNLEFDDLEIIKSEFNGLKNKYLQ
jgi:hypothetical protein